MIGHRGEPLILFPFTEPLIIFVFFFFNDTATTEIYTLSLHDALPISFQVQNQRKAAPCQATTVSGLTMANAERSEEHTSELQSRLHLVCRLLLEKKKRQKPYEQMRDWPGYKKHWTESEGLTKAWQRYV